MSDQKPTISQMEAIKSLAAFCMKSMRVPVVRKPDECGMAYEDLTIPSYDQVELKAWYIPAEGSNKLIICNHPMPMNRSVFQGIWVSRTAAWPTSRSTFFLN